MGKGSSGGEQIQRVIRELPEEAKPFLYGFGDKEIEDPETGEMIPNPDYVQGLLPRAQELFTGEMPEYQVAGFDPMQERAFNLADAGVGAYQPYLDAASDAQMQGIRATGQALDATQALAGQIPGQIGLGQQALGAAGRGVLAAAGRGEAAGMGSAGRLQGLEGQGQSLANRGVAAAMGSAGRLQGLEGQGQSLAGKFGGMMTAAAAAAERKMDQAAAEGRGVAADVTRRSRALNAPLESRLMDVTGRARGIAGSGMSDADIAAARARASTAQAQQGLMSAGRFGRGTAARGIASLRGVDRQFDPTSIGSYYNPFETQAIDAALADIERAGARQLRDVERQTKDQALRQGAFTGSRRFMEQFRREEPIREEILERQAKTAAGMRQAGYEQAAERARQSFEQARGRQLQGASTLGQLGQAGAGTQLQAAGRAGELGLGAEQLAQRSALEGSKLGLSGEQMAAANAESIARTGLSVEQLAASTGMDASRLAGQLAQQAGALNVSAAQGAGQMGLAGLGQDVATTQAAGQMGIAGAQAGLAGLGQDVATTQASGQMGMQAADMGMSGAGQAGQLGAQAAGLGLQGINTGLGAQQQAAGLGQGIGGLGMSMANLGGMQQGMGQSDINLLSQLGAQQQQFAQSGLDAYRANQMLPYQQVGFFSDILQGAPIGTAQTSFSPGPSPFQQFTGNALAYSGMQNAGVFG